VALFSNISRLPALDVDQRRVFLRADFDVPLSSFAGVEDDSLLRAALPTLRQLLAARSKLVIGAHYGSTARAAPSNAPRSVAGRLAELLGTSVSVLDRNFSSEIRLIGPGQIALTPNLLDYPEEIAGDQDFAEELARSIDVYVGDGLRAARESWASVVLLPRALASRGCGLQLGRDLEMLELLADPRPVRPYVAVVGGDGFARKAKLLWALLLRVDALLLGGVVANTCLAAQGWDPRLSAFEPDQLEAARTFLSAARERGVSVSMPRDALVIKPEVGLDSATQRAIHDLAADEAVVDIGLETCSEYREVLAAAGTALWNGLMGVADDDTTRGGTYRVAQAVPSSAGRSVVFGARSVAMAELLDLLAPFRYVSRGGEAALSFVSGTVLPGIESLRSPS
jgi:phosphoglycerate kinase